MRIGVDASYPPFAVATADDLFGLDIDLGSALGERLGIPVRFVNMGFDGLYDSLRADQVDVVISAHWSIHHGREMCAIPIHISTLV